MKLKVGAKEYEIVHKLELIEVGGELYGKHEYDEAKIYIANKYPQIIQNETFLHEMFHAIAEMQDLKDLSSDEHSIQLLAKGLYLVIKDNPHIFTMCDIKGVKNG